MTVYLVGAGPGDPGLMTVRGLELVKRADVILYDRLVNPAILDHAKGHCVKMFVGKEPGHHEISQDEINGLLAKLGKEHGCVVRLKGGDPFVFGRGGEEMDFLIENGMPFEVVPGVTSAIAGPAYAGLPVTRRGFNSSVTFLTGHNWDSQQFKERFRTLSGTLVILMGSRSFPIIGRDLMDMGYGPGTPVLAVNNATTYSQMTISGTLGEMIGAEIPSPSVIVVGGSDECEQAKWFERKLQTIKGKKVLVMRTPDQYEDTKDLLDELGAHAVSGGFYELIPLDWDKGELERASHVVITSANTVPLIEKYIDPQDEKTYLAIGPGTRKALERIGIKAEMPDEYTSEGLGMLIRRIVGPDARIVGLRSAKASSVLSSILDGLDYTEVPAYDIRFEKVEVQNVACADIVFFTSTAMVEAVHGLVGQGQVRVSIGPQTTSSMRLHGIAPHIEATASTIESMISATLDFLYSDEKRTK